MPLQEAIERAEAEGQPQLTFITQSQYLATLKELLELAVKKDLLAKNYADDLEAAQAGRCSGRKQARAVRR